VALDGEVDALDTYEAAEVAALRAIAHGLLSVRNQLADNLDDLAERITKTAQP
jgi:hypothetical protein